MSNSAFAAFLSQVTPLQPPLWLRGGQMETIYAKFIAEPVPTYRRELRWDSLGRNQVAYDFIPAERADVPLVVLFHGLEGSSHSHYAVSLMNTVREYGWHGVVVHFRSCGGVPSQDLYHAGDSAEIAFVLNRLAQEYPKIYAVGVSLGGNMLAKYLGEQGALRQTVPLRKAAVISAPVDLPQADIFLNQGLTRLIYTRYFLKTLLTKVPPTKKRIRSLAEFDNNYTAPMHQFTDKNDYYQRAQAKPHLPFIRTPTLLLNAENDPFLPAPYLPTSQEISDAVCLLQPKHGGHVGFVSGPGKGHLRWLPQTILQFFQYTA